MSGFTFTCAQRCFIKAQILLQFMLFPVLVAKMMPVIPRSCAKLRSSFLELSGKQNSPVFVFAGNRYFTRPDSTHSKVLQFRHTGSSRANGLQQKPETAVSACRTQKPKILSPFPCTEYYFLFGMLPQMSISVKSQQLTLKKTIASDIRDHVKNLTSAKTAPQ